MKEKCLNEMIYIKTKYIKKTPKREEEYCLDEEELHYELDSIIINFIKELGYKEIAEEYEDARGWFWYS